MLRTLFTFETADSTFNRKQSSESQDDFAGSDEPYFMIISFQKKKLNIACAYNCYLANIFQGRIEYELVYSLRGAKHRVYHSVHIR